MAVTGQASFAIHTYYTLPGELSQMRADDLLATAAVNYLAPSAQIAAEPLALKGVIPLIAVVKGELRLINVKELLLFFSQAKNSKLHPSQEIVVCKVDVDFSPLQLKALDFVCEASATKGKQAQEKMVETLVKDDDLLTQVRQILGLKIRDGRLTGIDLQRIFTLKSGTAHNRLKAVESAQEEHYEALEPEPDDVYLPADIIDDEGEPVEAVSLGYIEAVELALGAYKPPNDRMNTEVNLMLNRFKEAKTGTGKPINEEELRDYINKKFGETLNQLIEKNMQEPNWI